MHAGDTPAGPAAGPAAGIADWHALLAKALKGRDAEGLASTTRDDIAIAALAPRRADTQALPARGARRWTIVQPLDDPNPDMANANAKRDLEGGATGLSIRFAGSASAGARGLPSKRALAVALEGIDPAQVSLRLEPNPDGFVSAIWLSSFILESGVAPETARVSFGLDPISMAGTNPRPEPEQFAGTFHFLRDEHFTGPFATLDARPFHEAGASEAQELAAILAATAWWLRTLSETGAASPAEALPHLGAALAVDRDILLSIAKLRALRLLWARLGELCDVPGVPLHIHADTSRRMLTRADPPTNMLRNTVAAFAATVAGADSLAVLPHTSALGAPDRGARALALNLQHLLAEEAHLWRVADPAAGSGALEALTDGLCEHAWDEFQQIEREGGLIESLNAGAFQKRIADARKRLVAEVADGKAPLVGATIHPLKDAEPLPAPLPATPDALGLLPLSLEDAVEAA